MARNINITSELDGKLDNKQKEAHYRPPSCPRDMSGVVYSLHILYSKNMHFVCRFFEFSKAIHISPPPIFKIGNMNYTEID